MYTAHSNIKNKGKGTVNLLVLHKFEYYAEIGMNNITLNAANMHNCTIRLNFLNFNKCFTLFINFIYFVKNLFYLLIIKNLNKKEIRGI